MSRRGCFAAVVLGLFLIGASARAASAQVLFDVGAILIGGAPAGSSAVTYTASDGSLVPQFTIDKSVSPALGANGRVSFRVTSRIRLEAAVGWARPELRTKLGGDTDSADNATASQSIHQFVVSGGATAALRPFGKWHPFLSGSFGWLRELSEDQTLYQDGWVGKAGGGVSYRWQEKAGHFRPYGIRADVWLDVRHGGLEFSDRPRLYAPAFSIAAIFKL